MPKKAKELSAAEVRRLSEPGMYAAGGVAGLLLRVGPTGGRSWILRTKVGNKRRDIGLGGFPDVPLTQARERAREAKDKILQGIDPVAERQARRRALIEAQVSDRTFRQCAAAVHSTNAVGFRSVKHAADWISSLERFVFPIMGALPVSEITTGHVTRVLEPIWSKKTETATRVRQRIEAVLNHATTKGYRTGENPARWKGHLETVLPKPNKVRKVTHHAALPWQGVGAFMVDLREREGVSPRALEFIVLTAARSGEARLATWDEIDREARVWTVPAERMKSGKAHRVPLSDEALALLESLPQFGDSNYVFTAPRGGPLSDMSISAVTRRMGVDCVPHGFRSSFKDWARSSTAYPDEVSELALAHVNSDATRSAYARDELLPQRARLMADWARFCGTIQTPGEVVPIRGARA